MSERRRPWRPTWVAFVAGFSGLGMSAGDGGGPGGDASRGTAILSRLPLAFVENRGQWDTPARFVARRGGMVARMEEGGIVLQLIRRDGDDRLEGVLIHLAFEGAVETVALEGEGRQPGVYNFFLGNDPSKWRTEVPGYASVLYRGLRQGVDLRVREGMGKLEYDLLLDPGAEVEGIVVRCEGTEGIEVEPDGSLAMRTALGPVRQSPPVSWHVLAGGERAPTEARFRLLGPDRFGFEVTHRDPSLPLVIDPGVTYSTFLGASQPEQANAVALDANGAAVVAGKTVSVTFPTTPGAFDSSFNGAGDAFVTRLPLSGGPPSYSTFLGGISDEWAFSVALDANGAAAVGGATYSLDFPSTPGATDATYNGGWDNFVALLSPSGGALSYSTFLGGASDEWSGVLALDPTAVAVVGGYTLSTDFPTTPGAISSTLGGGASFGDGFVARLPLSGGPLTYSTLLGGSGEDLVATVALDAGGAAVVAGRTTSPDFPITAGAFASSYTGVGDAFVARLPLSGGPLSYSSFLGGSSFDEVSHLALDATGIAAVTGFTLSADFPTTPGAFATLFSGGTLLGDAFLARLPLSGGSLSSSTFLGGASDERAIGLALDATRAAVVVGFTASADFPSTIGAFDTVYGGGAWDAFVTRVVSSGAALSYSTFLGGSFQDWALAVALDQTGDAVATGYTSSADFPTSAGAYDSTYDGQGDALLLRLELLPVGATAYGASTPGCTGPLAIGVTSIPQVGNASFAITCGNGPANAFGFFGVSSAGISVPLVFNGLAVWIDPFAPLFFEIVVPSDPVGVATVPIPIPANPGLAGFQAFFQFAWFDGCAPGGFSASNALAVVVQP